MTTRKRPVCVATGTIWRWDRGRNRDVLLRHLRKLPLDGVELTFSRKRELYDFRLSAANRSWLRSLRYVSIHAPFGLLRHSEDERDLSRQLDILAKLRREVRAKTVVMHPHQVPERRLLRRFGLPLSIENMPFTRRMRVPALKEVLRRHPGARFCVDAAHAYRLSSRETARLVRAFGAKLSQIHLSGVYRKRDHLPLSAATPTFMRSVEPLRGLKCPIVIEEELPRVSPKLLLGELERVREWAA